MKLLPWWAKALILLAAIAAVIGAYKTWEHRVYQQGYKAADTEWQAKEARIRADAAEKLATATNEARAREQKLLADLNGMSIIRIEENEKHEKAIAQYIAAARAGALRLSVAINPRSIPRCPAAADPAPAGGPGRETRADLMPEVAETVLSVGGDIAKGVRDYNAVLDAYNRARETCNAGVDGG